MAPRSRRTPLPQGSLTRRITPLESVVTGDNLELLRRYGLEIWQNNPIEGFDLHKTILYEYLYSHLGRPPAQRIRTLLESHIEKKGIELAEFVMTAIKKDFPERYSLKEELDDMVLDLEKKEILKRV